VYVEYIKRCVNIKEKLVRALFNCEFNILRYRIVMIQKTMI